jgi:hypothetical protein
MIEKYNELELSSLRQDGILHKPVIIFGCEL